MPAQARGQCSPEAPCWQLGVLGARSTENASRHLRCRTCTPGQDRWVGSGPWSETSGNEEWSADGATQRDRNIPPTAFHNTGGTRLQNYMQHYIRSLEFQIKISEKGRQSDKKPHNRNTEAKEWNAFAWKGRIKSTFMSSSINRLLAILMIGYIMWVFGWFKTEKMTIAAKTWENAHKSYDIQLDNRRRIKAEA